MSAHQNKSNYERYLPQNYQPTDAAPLRSKAFSQIDNLPHAPTKVQPQDHPLNSQNFDKIAEIKKKYDKLLAKGVSKQNEAVENVTIDQNKSISGIENSKWEHYKKGTVSPQPNPDKHLINTHDKPTTPMKRQSYTRDFYPAKTQEKKSNLEENRVALSAMKSELQARLNELSAKTIMNSAIRQHNQQSHQYTANTTAKTSKQESSQNYARSSLPQYKYSQIATKNAQKQDYSNKYQKITSKYKQQSSNPVYRQRQRVEQKPKKTEEKSKQAYLSKYVNNKTKNQRESITAKNQQLSVISQKSNSNNSEIVIDNSIQLEEKPRDNEAKMSYVRQILDVRNDDMFRKTVDESVKYKKEKEVQRDYTYTESKYTLNKNTGASRYTNTSTYNKQKNFLNPNKNGSVYPQEAPKQKEFILQNLENNVGPIKRTTTEEHFKNYNKVHYLQNRENREESKDKYLNNYGNPNKNKEISNNQSSRYGLHLEIELGQATFGKKNQKDTLPTYEATPTASNPKSGNQIQKIKQRYGKSANAAASSNLDKSSISKQQYEFQPSKKPGWKNYQFKDNQQISNKIDRLDQKIKEIQSNKKSLNISFQPYESKISKNTYNFQKSAEKPQKKDLTEKYQDKYRNVENKVSSQQKQDDRPRARISTYYEKTKPMYSDVTLPEGTKTQTSGFAIKLMPVQNSNEQSRNLNCSFSDNSKSQTKQQFLNKMEFELKADSGIEQRKRKLKEKEKVQISNNIKTLVKIFGQQAVFDEIFRNNKIWFASQRSQTKWEDLKRQLKGYNLNLSNSQIRQEFQLVQSQNNPFFSVSDSKCDTKTLVSSYNQAKRHWSEKILKKFDKKSLEKEGLNASKIDFDKKGFILIQDLVRFLNIQSGTFLRNRDVAIIFKRINKGTDKISFDELINAVSC